MTSTGGKPEQHGAPGARRPMPPSIQPRPAQPASPAPARTPARTPAQRPAPKPAPASGPPKQPQTKPKRKRHWFRNTVVILLLAVLTTGVLAYLWVNKRIQHVDALSGAENTPGETYLIVGSDSREGWKYDDGTTGARTDTIMVLHKAPNGVVNLISIPRDSYVEIPGHKKNKVNAAFSEGGAQLLVETIEGLTGLTIDAYMEVGLTGVADLVDALGGVELCYDEDVDDWRSKLEWEAGCHVADGDTALAFARMRYSDKLGDIGRAARQRQLVSAVVDGVFTSKVVSNPFEAMRVADAGLQAFRVSDGTGPFQLARIALTFRSGQGDQAVSGTPPIEDWGYRVKGVGSTVLLDPDELDAFWEDVAEGNFEPGSEVGGLE
ncbi:LCP family protein [Demequina sp.]|uniref:LCP family protein n=1 Tax=Demequina sp. TaxID=2050685 RepID=UPI003D10AA47